jgi:NAD(P)-dependent dehydrogenase (short-subunit alcohol dehydrogenase family)
VTAKLANRVVVVTGGASGLGEAIVSRMAGDGDRVVIADVDEPRALQIADNLAAAGRPADAMTVDVTSEGEVAAMFDAVNERHGRLDALVCSAAIETRSSVVDCDDASWQRVIDVNLKGPFLCMKHGIPAIARNGGGAVVLLGSVLGAMGAPGYAAYCA